MGRLFDLFRVQSTTAAEPRGQPEKRKPKSLTRSDIINPSMSNTQKKLLDPQDLSKRAGVSQCSKHSGIFCVSFHQKNVPNTRESHRPTSAAVPNPMEQQTVQVTHIRNDRLEHTAKKCNNHVAPRRERFPQSLTLQLIDAGCRKPAWPTRRHPSRTHHSRVNEFQKPSVK